LPYTVYDKLAACRLLLAPVLIIATCWSRVRVCCDRKSWRRKPSGSRRWI